MRNVLARHLGQTHKSSKLCLVLFVYKSLLGFVPMLQKRGYNDNVYMDYIFLLTPIWVTFLSINMLHY